MESYCQPFCLYVRFIGNRNSAKVILASEKELAASQCNIHFLRFELEIV